MVFGLEFILLGFLKILLKLNKTHHSNQKNQKRGRGKALVSLH